VKVRHKATPFKVVEPGKVKKRKEQRCQPQNFATIKSARQGTLCWPWQHAINWLASTLGKTHSNAHTTIQWSLFCILSRCASQKYEGHLLYIRKVY